MHLSPYILSASAVAVMGVAGAWLPSAASAQAPTTRTVLGVYWSTEDFPSNPVADASTRATFRSRPDLAIDYFSEYFESDRFPAEDASFAFRDYIRRKYRTRRIDLVIAESSVALGFVLENRHRLFPGVPIVFNGFAGFAAPELRVLMAIAGLTGVVNNAGFGETLALALTHVGQLAMLRGISGSPVRPESYARAEIVAGRVGPAQAPPGREFDGDASARK